MERISAFHETLYKIDSTGRVRVWTIDVFPNTDGTATVEVGNGVLDGKLRVEPSVIREGKNAGRSNETTPLEQAIKESESATTKKQRLGYAKTIQGAKLSKELCKRPQLALNFNERNHDLPDIIGIQPKLNGIRCLSLIQPKETFQISKGNSTFDVRYMKDIVREVFKPGENIDGELYIHGVSLRHLSSVTKRPHNNPYMDDLEYHLYDVPSIGKLTPNDDFKDRMDALLERMAGVTDKEVLRRIKVVPTEYAPKEEYYDYFRNYVKQGFEGLIARNPFSRYVFGERTANLQKFKEFIDSEFQIVGMTTDKHGLAVFICCLPGNKDVTFEVVPLGSDEERLAMAKLGASAFIDKMLTCKYTMLLDSGIPEFAKGIAVRDYE